MGRKVKKLVRDRIPDVIRARGGTPKTRVLGQAEFRSELRKKLVEEAEEARTATTRPHLLKELADVHEVLSALCRAYRITPRALAAAATKKRRERGGFEKRLFLERTT